MSSPQTLHYIENVIVPRARPFEVNPFDVEDYLDIALIRLGKFFSLRQMI